MPHACLEAEEAEEAEAKQPKANRVLKVEFVRA